MTIPLSAGPDVALVEWSELRLRAIFDHCKWDPQCGDHPVLARFPLILESEARSELTNLAERLTHEALAAENEILAKPHLLSRLAIPAAIRRCFEKGTKATPRRHIRVMRFDFHYTTHGWQISEVNADVPGGYVEASGWNQLFATRSEGFCAPCSPTKAYADAVCEVAAPGSLIALAHTTVYSEDRQVMMHLGRELESRGRKACLISPKNLKWNGQHAMLATAFVSGEPAVVIRLSPAEWLPSTGDRDNWEPWFANSLTPLSNPGTAIVIQSKRFPLIWDELNTNLATWRKLLPKSSCPSQFPKLDRDDLVLKPAFGRVGEDVAIRGVTDADRYNRILRDALRRQTEWIAQERFDVIPIPTEGGDVFPCIGVYTVNGRMAGLYGRAAHTALIDHDALDVAVLLRRDDHRRPL
jgi:glutathionylspermidine synthase